MNYQAQMLSSVSDNAPNVNQIVNFQSVTYAIIFSLAGAISTQLIGRVASTLTVALALVVLILIVWFANIVVTAWDDGLGVYRFWKKFIHTGVSLIFLLIIYVVSQTVASWFSDTSSTGTVTLLQLFSPQIWVILIGLTFIQTVWQIDNGPTRHVQQLSQKLSAAMSTTNVQSDNEAIQALVKRTETLEKTLSELQASSKIEGISSRGMTVNQLVSNSNAGFRQF